MATMSDYASIYRELGAEELTSVSEERIRELEEQFEALQERIDGEEDSFDDDQLSRLGINNIVPDAPEEIRTSIQDLPRTFAPSPDSLLTVNNHGMVETVTVRDLHQHNDGVITPMLDVTGQSYFMGEIRAQEGIDVQGALTYNGTEITTLLDEMRERITYLEGEVRRLREQNGQDNS